jgi:hypothetical protein
VVPPAPGIVTVPLVPPAPGMVIVPLLPPAPFGSTPLSASGGRITSAYGDRCIVVPETLWFFVSTTLSASPFQ